MPTITAKDGTQRVAKAVLIGAVPLLMLRTRVNPGGTPMDAFDGIRAAFRLLRAYLAADYQTKKIHQ